MFIEKIKSIFIVLLLVPIVILAMTSTANAYTTQNVLGSTDFVSQQISTSTNGRYIAFLSDVSTLVPTDTNNKTDAFIKDTQTGTVSLLSVTPSGDSGDGRTYNNIMLTGNGRFALFSSEATNLSSTSGGYGVKNLYLRDITNSTTYLIAAGVYGSGVNNYPIGLSEDGRFVYYNSNISTGSPNGPRLYVMDRALNTTQRIDINSSSSYFNAGFQGSSNILQRQVSCDGRFVVLTSSSTNIVSGDTNGVDDIFLMDRMGGTITDITLAANGSSSGAEISCDGNYILFQSTASNLVSSDTNGATDLFKYKVSDATFQRVSVNGDGTEYSGGPSSTNGGYLDGGNYDMSMDGRYIFYIYALRGTSNYNYLTMRDTESGTNTVIASAGSNYYPWNPVASFDGRKVYYVSTSNLSNATPLLKVVTGHIL